MTWCTQHKTYMTHGRTLPAPPTPVLTFCVRGHHERTLRIGGFLSDANRRAVCALARLTLFCEGAVAVRAWGREDAGYIQAIGSRRSSCHCSSLVVMSYHYQKNEPGGYEDAYDMVSR